MHPAPEQSRSCCWGSSLLGSLRSRAALGLTPRWRGAAASLLSSPFISAICVRKTGPESWGTQNPPAWERVADSQADGVPLPFTSRNAAGQTCNNDAGKAIYSQFFF